MTHFEAEHGYLVERYLLGRLPEDVASEFEEHYFECRHCLAELQRDQEIVADLKEACRAVRSKAPRLTPSFLLPLPAWGLAAGLGIAAVFVSVSGPPPPAGPAIELSSYRAAGETPTAVRKPFLLRLDLRGLASEKTYRVELVSPSGEPIWSKSDIPSSGGDWLQVRIDNPRLPPGDYWLRLSGPAGLLREYALAIAP